MSSLLTVNGGSSSLKCALFTVDESRQPLRVASITALDLPGNARLQLTIGDEPVQESYVDVSGGDDRHAAALDVIARTVTADPRLPEPTAIVHRVVHGGSEFSGPVHVDSMIRTRLADLASLAPLHQPIAITLIDACNARFPDATAVACFDTAFHRDMPDVARHYALPAEFRQEGICAYGFHGLSYASAWRQFSAGRSDARGQRLVVAHLGAGASLCAIKNGKSIATTMGFSALDGVPMATRSGAVDAGVLLHLMRQHDMDATDLENLLYRRSGLLGLSGISGNLRDLQASGESAAAFAIRYLIYKVSLAVGSMVAALGGLDVLVFTGGIGENNVAFRAALCNSLEWLELRIDDGLNAAGARTISTQGSQVEVQIIPADEEGIMASQAAELI